MLSSKASLLPFVCQLYHVLIAKLFLESGLWCDQVLGGPSWWWWCFVVSNRYEVDWNISKNEILTHKLACKWTSSLNIWVSFWLIFNQLDDYIIDKLVNHWRKILLSCCDSGTAANKLIKRLQKQIRKLKSNISSWKRRQLKILIACHKKHSLIVT